MKSGIWVALGTAVLLTVFWDTSFILPFKYLVVLVHEMFHGLSSMAFGARIQQIVIHAGESGETLVTGLRGATAVVISVSAGYLGCALSGALLLRRGLFESFERTMLAVFGGVVLYMTLLFTHGGSLAFTTGLGWSLCLLFCSALGSQYARNALIIVGTMFLWYSFFDLFDFTRDVKQTDAGILARYARSQLQFQSSVGLLSTSVSIAWAITMLVAVWFILAPLLKRQALQPAPEAAPADPPLPAPPTPLLAQVAPAGPSAAAPPPSPAPAAPLAAAKVSPTPPAAPPPQSGSPQQASPNPGVGSSNDLAELMALRDEIMKDKNLQASIQK
ncbi:MAG: M50 family metallopeptidase [Leptospirales bacterium]|nr:M50 family metallopeptidase [Leptospirales bacterium]